MKAFRIYSKNSKGFTLLETLVYIGVLCVIVIGIFSLLLWLSHAAIKAKVMRETVSSARRAMDIIIYETKEAKQIYSPTTGVSQLSLETLKYLPSQEASAYVDFYICGTRLCLKKESQAPIALTSESVEIKQINFTKIITGQIPSLQVDLVVEYKNPSGKPEYQASVHLTSTASLRSY